MIARNIIIVSCLVLLAGCEPLPDPTPPTKCIDGVTYFLKNGPGPYLMSPKYNRDGTISTCDA